MAFRECQGCGVVMLDVKTSFCYACVKAASESAVEQMLKHVTHEQAHEDVTAILERMRGDERRRFHIAVGILGPLNAGDVVVMSIDGERPDPEIVEGMVEHMLEHDPSRFDSPIIVVPHGQGDRCRKLAEADSLHDVARAIVEAPAVAAVELVPALSARERAWFAWFDRDDVSDDELTELLAEQEAANWDEIEAVLDERQRRREERGDSLLVGVGSYQLGQGEKD